LVRLDRGKQAALSRHGGPFNAEAWPGTPPPKQLAELSETMVEINNLQLGISGKSTTYGK
jgi:hypothetical protein